MTASRDSGSRRRGAARPTAAPAQAAPAPARSAAKVTAPRARRPPEASDDTFICPRCGRDVARIIGRSEHVPIVYLRCDGCRLLSVMGA